jgi:formate dehydrogenase subunit delta
MRNGVEQLIRMANDIGDFFAAESDRQVAVDGIAQHIRRFWAPRMRRAIYAHLAAGGAGLGDLAHAAIAQLARTDTAAAPRD